MPDLLRPWLPTTNNQQPTTNSTVYNSRPFAFAAAMIPATLSVNQQKLVKRLRHQVGQAIADFNMIEDGDKVMVCLSGGKDSYALLDMLIELRRKAPVNFELVAVHLDQKQPDYPPEVLPNYLATLDIPHVILEQDTYSVVARVVPAGKTMCGLCSRLRRGALYRYAEDNGFTRIALGHHRDDIVETLFLNMFHGSKISAMPPKLLSDDGKHVVIRPLAYVAEQDLIDYATLRGFPIIPCNLCGSQETLQRKVIKDMLAGWERAQPGRIDNIFRSMMNIRPSQLADRALFDFASLGAHAPTRVDAHAWLAGNTSTETGSPHVV
jgi:tRNA 2-thiocytidine biosynthesis protein TtcA